MSAISYRPEIDGLRAVAVLPVILFHAGIAQFSGGYVGVDVFFVISGYLISSIILREMAEGRFSILRFWERRARRILPALYLVMMATFPLAWMLMLPDSFLSYARSVMAVNVFASNVLFWRESGYFAAAADEKPLLHTWSLAVEEQFYILFPLALFLLWRFGRRSVFVVILLVLLVSLGFSHIAAYRWPSANFYLLPSRAWELMAGALCALWLGRFALRANDLLAALGLLLILGAVFLFDQKTPFPSLYSLAPVVGTVLIILFAGNGGQVMRLLAWRPIVALGLVSYSAYLWHQPLFAFARIALPLEPGVWIMLGLTALALALAALSWRYVEQPFRNRQGAFRGPRLVAVLLPAWLLIIGLGAYGHFAQGIPGRFPPYVEALMKTEETDSSGCRNRYSAQEIAAGKKCVIGDHSAPLSLAVIGDSHASMLTDALSDQLKATGRSALMYSGNWCAPLAGFGTRVPRKDRDCVGRMTAAIAQVRENPEIDTVLLVGQWSNYTTGARAGDNEVAAYTFSPDLPIKQWNTNASANPGQFERALDATLRSLTEHGKSVEILLPVPEYRVAIPEAVARLRLLGLPIGLLDQSRDDYRARNRIALRAFEEGKARYDFRIFDPTGVFCADTDCRPVDDAGNPLYSDAHHLNLRGARMLVGALETSSRLAAQ